VARTIEIPIQVVVEDKPKKGLGLLIDQLSNAGVATAGGLALAFLLVAGVVALTMIQARKPGRSLRLDPVTQSVTIRQESSIKGWQPSATRSLPLKTRLVRLDSDTLRPIPGQEVLLGATEITLGSDRHQVSVVLQSSTVSALHARINPTESGGYRLFDCGSVAGTWVNYAPVSAYGARLENGDLVHLGRVVFRVELGAPPPPSLQIIEQQISEETPQNNEHSEKPS
jgi:hypothetical protein